MPQCCFVFSFSRISILSVVLFPIFHSRGLDFCVACWRLSQSYLSHEERRMPIPASTKTGSERSARQWSSWALHAQTHTLMMDTKDKLNYPSCYWTQGQQLSNALYPLSKQTSWTVRSSFQSEWQIRMTVSSTPRSPVLSSQRLSVTKRLLRAQR